MGHWVDHLNKRIKGRVDEPNMTPETLVKVTPALGHVQHMAEQVFADIGVTTNQHHAKLQQTKDIEILVLHLKNVKIFQFSFDRSSEHTVTDLYRHGLYQLAGPSGGHAKHLVRHKLCLRTQHGIDMDTYQNTSGAENILDDDEFI